MAKTVNSLLVNSVQELRLAGPYPDCVVNRLLASASILIYMLSTKPYYYTTDHGRCPQEPYLSPLIQMRNRHCRVVDAHLQVSAQAASCIFSFVFVTSRSPES